LFFFFCCRFFTLRFIALYFYEQYFFHSSCRIPYNALFRLLFVSLWFFPDVSFFSLSLSLIFSLIIFFLLDSYLMLFLAFLLSFFLFRVFQNSYFTLFTFEFVALRLYHRWWMFVRSLVLPLIFASFIRSISCVISSFLTFRLGRLPQLNGTRFAAAAVERRILQRGSLPR